jgi:hypothetical protein
MQKLTWPAVGLIAVLGAITAVLAAFTDWGSGEILGLVGILAGIGGGAAVAGGVAGRVDQLQAETTAQTVQLDTIERRVNGELDARIADAVRHGTEQVLSVLRQQGVIR